MNRYDAKDLRPPSERLWHVRLSAAEPTIVFKSQERGGPPVTPPKRKGFGTGLLKRAVATSGTPPLLTLPEKVSPMGCRRHSPNSLGPNTVRFGSLADIGERISDVRSAPISGHRQVESVMCGAGIGKGP